MLFKCVKLNFFRHYQMPHFHSNTSILPDLRLLFGKSRFPSCGYSGNLNNYNVLCRSVHSVLSRRLISESAAVSDNAFLISTDHKTFHTARPKQASIDGKNGNEKNDSSSLLETWFYEVSPFGSLSAQLPFSTVIQPLNPIDYPDMNKCIIEFYYNSETPSEQHQNLPNSHQLAQISEMYNLNVSFDKDKANMNLNCDIIKGVSVPVCCYLHVPLKFDLTVKIEGNENVTVENMESDSINIEADKGDITLKKIKSGSVSAMSKSGDIKSKSTLLGNTSLHCGSSGNISADKLQGSGMTCTTEMGSIDVKSLYTEGATFKTVVGDVRLGHCHGQICVVGEKSNLHIESLEGDLDAGIQQGSVSVHLSRHNRVDLDLNRGDVSLSFPDGARTDLQLSCSSVTVAENLLVHFDDSDLPHHKEGHIGEKGVAQVNIRILSGNICLDIRDWIQTTKLAFMDKIKEL